MKKISLVILLLLVFVIATAQPKAVDLGLSVKWADCNIGASRPEQYGDSYAWGETETKDDYSWETYKWCNESSNRLTKYNTHSEWGQIDGIAKLDESDDIASVSLGNGWRIPTDEEWNELKTQCIRTWKQYKGVNGYIVTSNKTLNSIFLPAAGVRSSNSLNVAGTRGLYWSSSLYSSGKNCSYAWHLGFDSDNIVWGLCGRHTGLSIRPVKE